MDHVQNKLALYSTCYIQRQILERKTYILRLLTILRILLALDVDHFLVLAQKKGRAAGIDTYTKMKKIFY